MSAEAVLPMQDEELMERETVSNKVYRFNQSLGALTVGKFESEIDLHIPDAVEYAAHAIAGHTPNGLYLTADFISEENDGGRQLVHFNPQRSRSGIHSRHGVMFGELTVGDKAIPVAVKPHEDDEARYGSIKETLTLEASKHIGMYSTQAVGVLLDGHKAYSIILRDDNLTTLDSVDWSAVNEMGAKGEELMATWTQIGRTVAMVHHQGSSHGDLSARNVAVKSDAAGAFLIDLEDAHITKVMPRDAEARYAISIKDMGDLMESMVRLRSDPFKAGLGMFGTDPDAAWQGFRELVLDEYIGVRMDLAKPQELPEVESELYELERSLQHHLNYIFNSYDEQVLAHA